MKRIWTGVVFFVVMPAPASVLAGTWTIQYQTAQSDTAIISMAAATEDKVFGFGVEPDGQGNSRGVWFLTSDGGKTWQKSLASPGGDLLMLTHLVCPSSRRCWAVGVKIMMSGGFAIQNILMQWTAQFDAWSVAPPLPYAESRVAPRDEENFYLVGGSVVLPFVASKAQKGFVPEVEGERFVGISDAAFVGASEVYLVNGETKVDEKTQVETILPKGALLRSTDGGKTFVAVFRGRSETVDRVWFFTSQTGFILGHTAQGPFIRRTDDGGQTWFEFQIPAPTGLPMPRSLADAVIFHPKAGLFVASDKDQHDQTFHVVYRMRDGYTLLREPTPSSTKAMLTLTCPSQRVCYMAGENHVIWRFDGTDEDVVPEEVVTPEPGGGSDGVSPTKDSAHYPDGTGDAGQVTWDGQVGDEVSFKDEPGSSSGGGCSTSAGKSSAWVFLALMAGLLARRRPQAR